MRWLPVGLVAALLVAVTVSVSSGAAQTPPYRLEVFGKSVQGRDLEAYRIGKGETKIAFIGGIHQKDEANSVSLVRKALDYYSKNPTAIPQGMTVIFIPNLNPDGGNNGTRENAHGVDLNRNWPTADWKKDTYAASGMVPGGGGEAPLSEPETSALWRYVQSNDIQMSVFYHARAAAVVDSQNNPATGGLTTTLARFLAWVTGYRYLPVWTAYPVTGGATDFLNAKGIYSLEIELSSYDSIEWDQNLRGMSAAISFFAPRFFNTTGHSLHGRTLAYWLSKDGDKRLGAPVSEAFSFDNKVLQNFEHGRLEYNQLTHQIAEFGALPLPGTKPYIPSDLDSNLTGATTGGGYGEDAAASAANEARTKLTVLNRDIESLRLRLNGINDRLGNPKPTPPRAP